MIYKAIGIISPILARNALKNEYFYLVCKYVPFLIYVPLYGLYIPFLVLLLIYVMSVHYRHATFNRMWLKDKIDHKGMSYYRLLQHLNRKHVDNIALVPEKLDYFLKAWECEGVPLGTFEKKLIYRKATDKGNFFIQGEPGSGKSVGYAITAALAFIKKKFAHIFVLDIKGEILPLMPKDRKIKVFRPSDPQNSCSFDVFYQIRNKRPSEQKTFLEDLALTLFHDDPHSSNFFNEVGRDFFIATAMHLLANDREDSSMYDVAKKIIQTADFLDLVDEIMDGKSEIAKEKVGHYLTEQKDVGSAFGTAKRAMDLFAEEDMKELLRPMQDIREEKPDSFYEFMAKQPITAKDFDNDYDIFIQLKEHELEHYAPILALITESLIHELFQRKSGVEGSNNPILFVLDELSQINHMNSLMTLLSLGRSYSVSAMLFVQSLSQLLDRYSNNEVKTMLQCCPYKCILSASGEEAEFYSKMFGTRKILQDNASEAQGEYNRKSISSSETTENVIRAEEFATLPSKKKVAIIAKGYHAIADISFYYDWKGYTQYKRR